VIELFRRKRRTVHDEGLSAEPVRHPPPVRGSKLSAPWRRCHRRVPGPCRPLGAAATQSQDSLIRRARERFLYGGRSWMEILEGEPMGGGLFQAVLPHASLDELVDGGWPPSRPNHKK